MAYQVRTNVASVEIGNQFIPAANTTVTISDSTYNALSPNSFSGGSPVLTVIAQVPNPGDAVYVQGTHVNAPAALTSAQVSAAPTQANFNALQTDVAALSSTLTALLAAISGTAKPMA